MAHHDFEPRLPIPGRGAVALPELAGTLSVRERDLADAERDFGGHVHRRPLAVAFPATAVDVATLVRFGRAHGIPVVPRGAGHSVDGQALVSGGIAIDMSTLGGVRPFGPDRISVDAGARWRAVVDTSLRSGTVPPVLPDYLELSVGGLLSTGGFGGASHRYGSQADNVHDLDVVTPDGELVTCSPTTNPALFDAVRGTQGRHGIITRATVALTRAPSKVRRHRLTYHDLGAYLEDQRRLVDELRFDHVDGQAQYADGRWRFVLEAVSAQSPPIDDLRHDSAEIVEATYREFVDRILPIEARLRSTGSWYHPHPRANVLLPGASAGQVLASALAELTPEMLGVGGSVLLYLFPTARITAPHVPKARDPHTVLFGVQRTAPPGDLVTLQRMREANAALHATARRLGGASYAYPLDATDAQAA
ncbi:FAD-binding protein [Amycolatopsis pittospori]|uniref:FAD-binding protein n=1 Tax=Amycolatopsis pittospori TaxID=2749434 RepID=UPI0015F0062E|nr:FAD-binding protein [Amycolatopsis pittospori]